jgi:flagellar motor switch protein FliG
MDERVNGAKIAAQIIRRMKGDNRSRLMQSIEQSDPAISMKIKSNMFSFDEIAQLAPQSVQLLMKEVAHNDLVLSLKLASPEVKDVIFQNLSERKRAMLAEDLSTLPPTRKTEVESAQERILLKLDELRTKGTIRSQDPNDVWV